MQLCQYLYLLYLKVDYIFKSTTMGIKMEGLTATGQRTVHQDQNPALIEGARPFGSKGDCPVLRSHNDGGPSAPSGAPRRRRYSNENRAPIQGRPTTLYSLTNPGDAQFPRDYAALAMELLPSLNSLTASPKSRRFSGGAAHLIAGYGNRVRGEDLEKRVREMAAVLTDCGYMAEVEAAGPGCFLLIEHNCAIREAAKCHPVACQEELCLIGRLCGGNVARVSHVLAETGTAPTGRGGWQVKEARRSPSPHPEPCSPPIEIAWVESAMNQRRGFSSGLLLLREFEGCILLSDTCDTYRGLSPKPERNSRKGPQHFPPTEHLAKTHLG
jgi:hypothetical protein